MSKLSRCAQGALVAMSALLTACAAPDDETEAESVETDDSAIFGLGSCKDVTIRVTNNFHDNGRPTSVYVKKLVYTTDDYFGILTEDLRNTEIAYGRTATWNPNLQGAKNEPIDPFVVFDYLLANGEWYDETAEWNFFDPDPVCVEGITYSMTLVGDP
jgi:hypothetical protein